MFSIQNNLQNNYRFLRNLAGTHTSSNHFCFFVSFQRGNSILASPGGVIFFPAVSYAAPLKVPISIYVGRKIRGTFYESATPVYLGRNVRPIKFNFIKPVPVYTICILLFLHFYGMAVTYARTGVKTELHGIL